MKKTLQKISTIALAFAVAFAVVAPVAPLSAQSAAACTVYVRDLTMGSTGSDVVALQTFLEEKGHLTIPAGVSKGYFGALTRAALGRYQASQGIMPTAGYFGPITRANINIACAAGGGTTPTTPGGNNNGGSSDQDLDGDGDVKDFDIKAEDDAESASDDNHVATIEFEVEDGDVSLQKVDLFFDEQTVTNDLWENIESIMLMVDGDEIGSIDASDEDEWSEEDDDEGIYGISIDTDDFVFGEDDKVEIEVVIETSNEVETGDADEDYTLWAELRFINGEDVIFYEGGDEGDDSDAIDFSVTSLDNFEINFDENSDSPDSDDSLDLSSDLEETLVIVDAEIEDNQGGTLEDATVEIVVTLSNVATTDLDIDELIEEIQFFVDGDEIDADDVSTPSIIAQGDSTVTLVYSFDLDDMEVDAEDAFEIEVVGVFNELDDDSEFIGATVKVEEITIDGENQEGDDFSTQSESTAYSAEFTATAGDVDIEFTEDPEALVTTTDPYDGTIVFTVSVENNTGSTLTGMSNGSNWEFDVEGYGGITVESVTDEDGNAADDVLTDGEDAEYEITLGFTSKSSKDLSIEIEEIAAQNIPVSVTWEE